jgi:glycosyltransferase involved in cell wall biosynthesis
MAAAPFFSVVMPVYNGEGFLPDALASLKAQEPFDGGWEAVAADDGSSDGSRKLLEAASKEMPLRVIDGAKSGNWVASTNKAVGLCRGEWVVFLHQDDAYAPSRLRRLRETAERFPECGFLANDTRFFASDGRDLGPWRAPLDGGWSPPAKCFPPIFVQDNFAVPGVAVRRDLLVETGGLDESLPYTADWDAWLRFSGRTGVARVAEDLSFFRVHGGSQTVVSFASKREAMRDNLQTVFDRHLPTLHALLPPREADRWERLARMGLAADLFLAAAGMGGPLPVRRLLKAAFRAGPHHWPAFLRLHGTIQRVRPRLRARINGKKETNP